MELYLQFGYGMMDHCRCLISSWGRGTAILSPRDLNDGQLIRLGAEIGKLANARTLLDPQFYLPNADHERLCSHRYWPKDYETGQFWEGPALTELITKLLNLNVDIGCAEFVIPGVLAQTVNDDWLATQQAVLEEAQALDPGLPLVMTVALGADAVRSADQIAMLLERAERWAQPNGYYLVCEHPNGQYLVEDPNWVANVLDLTAGLRILGAEVILGYCNHQMLIASCAQVNAISSGTWMNVRSFPPEKFSAAYDEEMKQRATWYYCPQSLSEYKIPFLDIALRLNMLTVMAPPVELDGGYATSLFSGVQPSTVGFGEQPAFRHYLHALHEQVARMPQESFDVAVNASEALLDSAERTLQQLGVANIRGQLRDFRAIVDVNRAAIGLFRTLRGAMLRRLWPSL